MNKKIIAALFSAFAFPGVGQLINGEIAKGIIIIILFPLAIVITTVTLVFKLELGLIFSVSLVCAYFWIIYDAYRGPASSQRRTTGSVKWS